MRCCLQRWGASEASFDELGMIGRVRLPLTLMGSRFRGNDVGASPFDEVRDQRTEGPELAAGEGRGPSSAGAVLGDGN